MDVSATWVAAPTAWGCWSFELSKDGDRRGRLDVSPVVTKGSIVLGERTWRVSRPDPFAPLRLHDGEVVVATAGKAIARRSFTISWNDDSVQLRQGFSVARRRYSIERGDEPVGTIVQERLLVRRMRCVLPDSLPPEIQAFAIWLAIALMRGRPAQQDFSGGVY